ncbi:MAG: LptA/OstA family protein [Candidatus Muiribacteriota bacterium]
MKKLCLTFIIISLLNGVTFGEEQSDFMKNSVVTGNVMEFSDNIRHIRGDFKVDNPDYQLTAGQGKVDSKKNIMEAHINVKLTRDNYVLTSNKLVYYMNEDRAVCTGNPEIIESFEEHDVLRGSSTIKGNRIIIFNEEDRMVVEDNVEVERMTIEDGREKLDYRLFADQLTYYNISRRTVAVGNVKVERTDSIAYGDRLVFYEEDDRIEIVGNAYVERENGDKVNGEKIVYFMQSERVLIFNARAEVYPTAVPD